MALREVKPLNAEQWKQVTTAEQRKIIAEALERAKKLQEIKQ